jgi:hypothetical protein
VSDHQPLPFLDRASDPEEETEPIEEETVRPRWYWPLFAAMLAALAVAAVLWPIVVYQALIP